MAVIFVPPVKSTYVHICYNDDQLSYARRKFSGYNEILVEQIKNFEGAPPIRQAMKIPFMVARSEVVEYL
jgi:hypothetical protein